MAAYTANGGIYCKWRHILQMPRLSKGSFTKIETKFYPSLTKEGTNISAWLYSYAFLSVKMG
jgi:hypothetical protein